MFVWQGVSLKILLALAARGVGLREEVGEGEKGEDRNKDG